MQILEIDLSANHEMQIVTAKQGDVGRKFKVVLKDAGVVYTVPRGAQFSVWYSGPSGQGNYSSIGDVSAFTVEENTVTVELITQMLVNAGIGAMCLVLNGADGSQIGMWNIAYAVEAVPGMGSEAAEQYYTALSEVAEKAVKAAETFQTDTTLRVSERAADAATVGIALEGKAPAGYGLGEKAVTIDSWDNVKGNGFFQSGVGGPTENHWYYGLATSYDASNTWMVVKVWLNNGDGSFASAERSKIGGTWQPWEWVNPPMKPGEEYRTTERWNGKAVYTKLVNCGKAVNSLTQISHGSTVTNMLRCYGSLGGYCTIPYFTKAGLGGNYTYWCNATTTNIEVYIGAEANVTAYTVYVQIWYTKD